MASSKTIKYTQCTCLYAANDNNFPHESSSILPFCTKKPQWSMITFVLGENCSKATISS